MKTDIFKKLGPGLLFAGAAIGVSHLVQSTRAGADFGWGLLWALLIVNLFKFPLLIFVFCLLVSYCTVDFLLFFVMLFEFW